MAGRFDDNNKRIHAQRKFAQGAAVLPSRESLRELPLQNPVQKEPEQITPRICNDRAEDLLTKVCFKDWEIVPETMEMALKKAVVVLSDVMLKPLDAKPHDAKLPEAAESIRKSASKVPLSQPDLAKKMARQNAKKKAATKGSNTSSTSKRKSLRCALKHITDGVESTSIDKPGSLSLRNRIIEKKTSVNKVKKIEMDIEASTKNKTKELSRVQNEPTSGKNIAPNYVKAHKTIPYKRNKLNNVSGASVEKSFNDSDEEPLVKKVKKNNKERVNMKRSKAIKSINQIAKIVVKSQSEEFSCETATDDVYEFREETESPILGKRQISANNIEPSESSNNESLVLCSQSLCKPVAEIIDTGLNDILIHSIKTVNRTESSDCMESNDINENSGEHIQPEQNVNNTRVNDLIQIDIENCEPKLESDTELRAEIFMDEEDCNIENTKPTMFVYEESSNTMIEAPKEENTVDSQELIFVMPPSPQITVEDIKSEDDIILVKNSQIPTIHLQTQLDTIMKQVADLKNTVELTSHKKTLKPTKNMLRSPVKPRQGRGKSKVQTETIPKILPVNDTVFPKPTHSANIVEAPVFMPTEEEFQDPFDYIEKITPYASQFGIARIIPPPNFKPECNLDNDVRFTSNKQFIHRMRSRWGPSTRDMAAITSYLKTQQISLDSPPIIGGLDADLPRLYQVVEDMGGVKQVMGKWTQVSRTMNIPKLIPNPKLQDMYLKYILPFVTLSAEEREEYFRKANIMWAAARATKKSRRRSNYSPLMVDMALPQDEDSYTDVVIEEMDCVTKGKVMNYAAFTKMCKNAMNMWFRSSRNKRNRVPEPSPEDVESQFWRIVEKADKHIVVHSASINTEDSGIGFIDPTKNVDVSTNHPWNLKVMCNNPRSVLRSMGTLMGVTIPTLHLGMVFSTSCWYRDPHGLPWIEFLHRGSPKIWYGLPESEGERLKAGFRNLAPFVCKNKKIWLPSDTTMIPPEMLRDTGVSLCRTVQNSGEYVLVFPKAYSSSICTGSSVSESVYLSTFSWLMTAYNDFEDLHGSCEPSLFSLEHLLISIAEDATSNNQLLMHSHSLLTKIFESEKENRGTLRSLNIPLDERPARCEEGAEFPALVRARSGEDIEECDVCKQRLHLSYVYDLNDDDQIFCLPHAIDIITKETAENYSNAVVHCKYSSAQLNTIMKRLIDRLTIHIGDQP